MSGFMAGAARAAEPIPWSTTGPALSGDEQTPWQTPDTAPPEPAPPEPAPTPRTPAPPEATPSPVEAPPSEPPTSPKTSALSSAETIKAILALLVVFALAYLGGHPRVRQWERKIGVAQIVTAGFPFILLGLVGRSEGFLTPAVLDAIGPLMPLGLGWIGFALGIRVEVRAFEGFPRVLVEAFLTTTLIPLAAIMGAAMIMLAIVEGMSADASFIRDAVVLATAGIVTARPVLRLIRVAKDEEATRARVERLIQLEELAAFVVLILLSAFFRTDANGGWSLPSAGWVFVTIGVGAALGLLVYAALGQIGSEAETAAVLLGSICLAAGAASSLHLSPLALCFLSGALIANFPSAWKERVRRVLDRLERPIHLLFLVLAGALWQADAWEAWVLMGLFVASRLASRALSFRLFARRHPEVIPAEAARVLAASPMGPLAMAIVISAHQLFSGPTVPWIVHALIGGAIATELALHLFRREPDPEPPPPASPTDAPPAPPTDAPQPSPEATA
ncbi:MAG: hypothetical protein IT385_25875 [Deltaproteobacteria bacterium]|nr:hypothetical protein [Deltaproteobacteria bacterium]